MKGSSHTTLTTGNIGIPKFDLTGIIALITGVGSEIGIGRAIARTYAWYGAGYCLVGLFFIERALSHIGVDVSWANAVCADVEARPLERHAAGHLNNRGFCCRISRHARRCHSSNN